MLRAPSKTESRWRNQRRAWEGGCVFPPSGRWSARRRGGVSMRAPLARGAAGAAAGAPGGGGAGHCRPGEDGWSREGHGPWR